MSINELAGIHNVGIAENGAAEIEMDDNVNVSAVLAKVKEAGYEAQIA
jgi:hypothetical protein